MCRPPSFERICPPPPPPLSPPFPPSTHRALLARTAEENRGNASKHALQAKAGRSAVGPMAGRAHVEKHDAARLPRPPFQFSTPPPSPPQAHSRAFWAPSCLRPRRRARAEDPRTPALSVIPQRRARRRRHDDAAVVCNKNTAAHLEARASQKCRPAPGRGVRRASLPRQRSDFPF